MVGLGRNPGLSLCVCRSVRPVPPRLLLQPGQLRRPLPVLLDALLQAPFEHPLAGPADRIVKEGNLADLFQLVGDLLELPAPLGDDAPGRAQRQALEVEVAAQQQLQFLIGNPGIGREAGDTVTVKTPKGQREYEILDVSFREIG